MAQIPPVGFGWGRGGIAVALLGHARDEHCASADGNADHAADQGSGTGAGAAAVRAIDRRIQRWRGLRREGGERMDGFGEADALLGTAEARRADADRPVALTDVAKAARRAVGMGLRALAADLV